MERDCAWNFYSNKDLKHLEEISEEYRDFLNKGKTERECVDYIVNTIELKLQVIGYAQNTTLITGIK